MSIPLFYPPPTYRHGLSARGAISLRELCVRAQVSCRASGAWVERPIVVRRGAGYGIVAEPGGWGVIHIHVPRQLDALEAARHALGAIAYGLMDIPARESIRGQPWSRPAAARGRRRSGVALSNRERQRRYRARHSAA